MPSRIEDPDQSFGDNDDANTPTHNRPWPKAGPLFQARFEREYLVEGQTINFDSLPKMQSWASWLLVSDALYTSSILNRVSVHATLAQRPLTGLEANAIGEHVVHSLRTIAWAQPLAIGIAVAVTVNGRRTFKFPLFRPKKMFDPCYFPTRKVPLLKGPKAVGVWHAARLCAYLPLVWVPTGFVFTSIATTSFIAHSWADPRLGSLFADIRQAQGITTRRHGMEKQPGRQTSVSNAPGSASQSPQPEDNSAYGDAPTSRAYGSTEYPIQPNGALGRSNMPPEAPRTTRPNWARSTSTQSTGHGRNDDPDFLDDDDDDDASPIASSARKTEAGKGPSGSSSSSWDRIRRQAKSGDPNWEAGDSSGQERGWAQLRQDKTRNPKDSNPRTDSYTYSSGDEERERRNYEKEQAQKEFDALLEAERHGDDSSGKGRGWRK